MKIVAFGEVMMRMMPPQYKTLTQVHNLEFLFTGTGMNVLSGLYQMGHEVYLITRLPNHNVGKAAAGEIRKLGIKDNYISYGGNHIGVYFLEQGIGNRASQITYLNRKESSFCKSQITDYDLSCLDGKDALHICGIALSISTHLREVVFTFVKEAKKRGLKIIFDCNFRPSLWSENKKQVKEIYEKILYLSDVVFAGYKDATLLLGIEDPQFLSKEEKIKNVMQIMRSQYHIETLFGTIRTDECLSGFMVSSTDMVISSPMKLTVFDRVGGGDGFAAGAIHGYFSRMEPEKLIQFATASGVLAHTTYGDSPILTKEVIQDYLENGTSDIKR